MRSAQVWVTLGLVAAIAVAGCSRDKDPKLLNIKNKSGSPDEFMILPTKPLEMPQDLAALPQPTPGGTNRADINPHAEAVASLGGNPSRVLPGTGVARADSGLLGYASRYGVAQNIRGTLAAEDLQFRRDNNGKLLERLANTNVYFTAYFEQSLDQHAELERWRRAGYRTPAAPPEESLLVE